MILISVQTDVDVHLLFEVPSFEKCVSAFFETQSGRFHHDEDGRGMQFVLVDRTFMNHPVPYVGQSNRRRRRVCGGLIKA